MTKGEEQKARLRRIMGAVVSQLLVEMKVEDVDLSESLTAAFDAEPAANYESMEGLSDEALRSLCREVALMTAPPEYVARLSS